MISIIIPAYNEEAYIKETLRQFRFLEDIEVIVSDGLSTDRTVACAEEFPVTIIRSQRGKARQMNNAAAVAKGEILWFLHADTIAEEGACAQIKDRIAQGFIGGCLSQRIAADSCVYRAIEASGNFRAKLSKIFYGDQAIFVRRDVFYTIGGYSTDELFEDVLFSKKLRRMGRTCVLSKKIVTSARRWQKQGVFRATCNNWFLTLGFSFGIPTSFLKGFYEDVR